MSTFTVAKNLERVANGADVGSWDAPTNSNWSIVDAALGQSVTIGLNNSNVVLSTPQYQCAQIIFNSTLTGSVTITFPSTFTGPYIIQNLCTGTSVFTVTLKTTNPSGQVIGCPTGDSFHAINDGTNLKFHNIGRVGSYWDYAGSSVPNWVSACTVAPWLNCDGTQFSSATFPALTVVLGSTTLPDRRGTTGYTLNQGTGRLTTLLGGLDGNTNYSIKTGQATLGTSNLPPYTPAGVAAANFPLKHLNQVNNGADNVGFVSAGNDANASAGSFNATASFVGNAQGGVSNVMPVGSATVYGLSMIRSA